ncbi:MAG TPA: hypothetical protein VKE40_07470 [Gemmataceae bacterium]|nr:hypothetical protein [Gemmataceae bacterium]
MTIPILTLPDQRDRAAACNQSGRPARRLRRDVLAAARERSNERASHGTDDPWLESWRKLLAKYRRR